LRTKPASVREFTFCVGAAARVPVLDGLADSHTIALIARMVTKMEASGEHLC
jgi:hypothetical protein